MSFTLLGHIFLKLLAIGSIIQKKFKIQLASTDMSNGSVERLMSMHYQFQITAIALIILGSVLLNDDQMTGEYVYHIYIRLYFCGLNFTDIIIGLGNLMVVLGTLDLFANVLAVIADVKFPVNKTKSALVLYCQVFKRCFN